MKELKNSQESSQNTRLAQDLIERIAKLSNVSIIEIGVWNTYTPDQQKQLLAYGFRPAEKTSYSQ